MYRVMIRDNMSPVAKEILEAAGNIEVVVNNDKAANAPEVLAGMLKDIDGLAIRSGTKIIQSVFDQAPRLKVIGRAGIGVDNIDVEAATARGVFTIFRRKSPSSTSVGRIIRSSSSTTAANEPVLK